MTRERLLLSTDSYTGVSDLDANTPEIQMRSLSPGTPPKPHDYDYAVTRPSHFYEELPRLRTDTHYGQYSSTDTVGVKIDPAQNSWNSVQGGSSETNQFITDKVLRKRYNPLYDGVVNRFPDTKQVEPPSKPTRHICYLYTVTILCLIVALGSLGLSVYILFITDTQSGLRKTNVKRFEELYGRLSKNMSEQLKNLEEKNGKLRGDIERFQKEIRDVKERSVINAGNIFVNHKTLLAKYDQLGNNLTDSNKKMKSQVAEITKMEGPQGPPGVGNLSSCYYFNDTNKLTGVTEYSISRHFTSWTPRQDLLKNNVVMGAACSVYGGTLHTLSSRLTGQGVVQYRCECGGSLPKMYERACTIHMWLCPRIS